MKAFKISALAAAVVAASAASTAVQADAAQAWSQFANDSSMSLHLRNFYQKRDYDLDKTTTKDDEDNEAWSQAVRLDFQSGLAGNVIGLDGFAYYNQKLMGDKDEGGQGVLRGGRPGSQESHGKSGVAVKVNLMDYAMAKAGDFRMTGPLMNDSDSRALPSVRRGFQMRSTFSENLNLYTQIVTGGQNKTESGHSNYEDADGDDKSVNIIGGDYTFGSIGNGLLISGAYGKQTNVIEAAYASVNVDFDIADDMNLALGSQYGTQKATGDQENANKALKDDDISWYDASAKFSFANIGLSASYQSVEQQDKADGVLFGNAYYKWSMNGSDDPTGFYGSNSVQVLDFDKNGEDSWQVRADVDFADWGVPGLKVMTRYIDSTQDKDSAGTTTDLDNSEWDTNIGYTIQDGAAKGLGFLFRYAVVNEDFAPDAGTTGNHYERERTDMRFITTYNISIF